MANTIQVKRGAFASLPTLAAGELGFSTDSKQVHIGDGAANHEIVTVDKFDAGTLLYAVSDNTPVVKTRAELMALLSGQAGADFAMGTHKITGVVDPTANQDVATKYYVDSVATGLDVKASCDVATAAALPTCTVAGSGVGKTLTASAVGILTVDGVATVLNDRILVKNQAAGADNGIYKVTTAGTATVAFILTRATDFDTNTKVTSGAFTFISDGTASADQGWVLSTNDPLTLDTTALAFSQFSGAGTITAGAGLTKTGDTLDVGAGTGVTVAADTISVNYGTAAGTACIGNDARLSNARTPTVHNTTHVTGGSDIIANAVAAGNAGLMTGADKTKLDGVAASANNYSHPTGDGNLHVIATSTTNDTKVLTAGATAGSLSWTVPTVGTVTAVSGTAPVVSSGGATPAISIPAATASVAGHATAAQITKLDGIEALADVTDLANVTAAGAFLKDGSVAMTGAISKALDNGNLSLNGGQTYPASVVPYGKDSVSYGGSIMFNVTNAAKTGVVNAVKISGISDTPLLEVYYGLDMSSKAITNAVIDGGAF